MKNNDINFDENPKINEIKINENSKVNKRKEYKNIFLCPLNKSDCVNSIDIFDDLVLYGTIMGNVYLCRININNLNQNNSQEIYLNNNNNQFENNSKNANKNETQYEIKLKYKIEEKDSSKISCIKLNTNNQNNTNNNNNQFNGNETLRTNNEHKKEKLYFESDILPTTKNAYDNIKNNGLNIKHKLLNIIEKNNSKSDKSMIDNDSINKKDSIPFPQITQLILNATENVPCVTFDTKDKINISIGDYEIIRLENMSTFNINDDNSNYNYIRIRNYPNENEHIIKCESTTCMMTDKYFLIVHTIFGEYNTPISLNKVLYENKMMTSYEVVKGEIEMYNYSIPFDFDGDRFLFLDYETDILRRICIYYTLTKKEPFVHKISNGFGHINYMKFLLNDKIILCKNQKICEIYKIDENFRLLDSWIHDGNEIIAMNIYIEGTKDTETFLDDSNTNLSFKRYNENESQTVEINTKKGNNSKKKIKHNKIENIYSISPIHHSQKRKHLEKEKSSSSTIRELNLIDNGNLNIKAIKRKYNMIDRYNNNSDINNRKNRFEENMVEIYSKHKTPSIKDNTSFGDNKKRNIDENNNNFHLSNKELIKKNEEIKDIIQDKNEPTERSFYRTDKKIYIITVDLNGNFNLYHNNKNKTIFNLYKINNIDNKYKEDEFFALGFPYYVTMNSRYYAISTDHGIFVISDKL